MKDHYQTKHIWHRVKTNSNDQCTLQFGIRMSEEGDPEPEDFTRIREQLNVIFEEGGLLVLEVYQNWDDEGGECYQAFVIAPGFRSEYLAEYDAAVNPPTEGPNAREPDLLFVHGYLAANPSKFWQIWAGPY